MRKERVVIVSGPLQGKVIDIKTSLSIGRNPGNDLQLEDLQISRQHAVIEQGENSTKVRDLNSGNGSFIGDRRIIEYKLSHGDIIRLGNQELRFETEDMTPEEEQKAAQEAVDEGSGGVRFDNSTSGHVEGAKAANVFETFFQSPGAEVGDTDKLTETQQRLRAVYKANEIITSERDLNKLFERVLEEIFSTHSRPQRCHLAPRPREKGTCYRVCALGPWEHRS